MIVKHQLTRQQLYELVWSKPMTHVAKQFGLSDRGLAKLCERHTVPVPSRGYWAKLAAGKQTNKLPLPSATSPLEEKITIHEPTPVALLEEVNGDMPQSVLEIVERFSQPKNKVSVPAQLRNPCPVVASWQAEVKRERSNRAKWYGTSIPYSDPFAPPLAKRRLRLIDTLIKQLMTLGYVIEAQEYYETRPIHVRSGRDQITFYVNEPRTHKRRLLTDEEKKERFAPDSRKWTHTSTMSGDLRVQIRLGEHGQDIGVFRDQLDAPVEDFVNDMLVLIVKGLWQESAKRQQAEERERQRAIERRKEQDAYEAQKVELERRGQLEKRAEFWQKAQTIRQYVDAVLGDRRNNGASPEELEKWAAWARSCADQIDPLVRGDALSTEPRPVLQKREWW